MGVRSYHCLNFPLATLINDNKNIFISVANVETETKDRQRCVVDFPENFEFARATECQCLDARAENQSRG